MHLAGNLTPRAGLRPSHAAKDNEPERRSKLAHTSSDDAPPPQMTLDTLPSAETDYGCLSSFQSDFFFFHYMCELESSALIMALLHTLLIPVITSTGASQCVFKKKKRIKNKINQLLQLRDESVILNTFAVSHHSNLFPQHVRRAAAAAKSNRAGPSLPGRTSPYSCGRLK